MFIEEFSYKQKGDSMTKVFIVYFHNYDRHEFDDYHIIKGIFSSKEKAEDAIGIYEKDQLYGEYTISELVLDEI
jgi:hypothetical protein